MTMLKLLPMLVVFLVAFPAVSQDQYTAESEFFSLVIPAGWVHRHSETGILLTRDTIRVTLFELAAADTVAELVDAAFSSLGISPGTLISQTDAPLPNGAWTQQIYSQGSYLHLALAQARDTRALVVVIEGEQAALQALNPQILQLLTSISFGGLRLPDYVAAAAYSERDVNFWRCAIYPQRHAEHASGRRSLPGNCDRARFRTAKPRRRDRPTDRLS